MIIRQIAHRIRHFPGIERADALWSRLHGPFYRLLNIVGEGDVVMVGGVARVRIPPEYSGKIWESFEPASVAAFHTWVREHRGAVVLDLGCSIGIYSAIALFAETEATVVAFDSDLASLHITKRMARYAAGDRLQLVYGLLADSPTETCPLGEAVATTALALTNTNATGELGTTRYICLTAENTESIPRRRLDDLFPDGFNGRACLMKCDVEGAEQVVLSGGERVLRQFGPDLLLSVHPSMLPQYGHSTDSIRAFLTGIGYAIRCIAIDHEEHWWCWRNA
jgi:FkbM family methyltransferase